MSDLEKRDKELIAMGKKVIKYFGEDGLDKLLEYQREKTEKQWRQKAQESGRQDPGYLLQLFNDKVHDYEIIRNDEKCLEVKVYSCKHAEVFKDHDAEEMGKKLICAGDYAVVAGYNPDMELKRPETAMIDDCCHFIFER